MMRIDSKILEALPRAVRAEIEENSVRKDLTHSEMVKTYERAEATAKAQAEQRVIAGKSGPVETFPQGSKGKSRDKIGALAGVSGRTYDKAKAIVRAAE